VVRGEREGVGTRRETLPLPSERRAKSWLQLLLPELVPESFFFGRAKGKLKKSETLNDASLSEIKTNTIRSNSPPATTSPS